MLFVLRKSNVIISVLTVCLSLTALFLLGSADEEEIQTFAVPASNKVVVIDAGHGGKDAGASGESGINEKDLNLKIALKLQELVEQSGGIVILTRDSDTSLQNPNRNKSISPKQSDLLERKKILDESQADVFVSIHMNSFTEPQYRGTQVFYANNGDGSRLLGVTIQDSLSETLKEVKKRKPVAAKNGSIFVLKNAAVPAVLVECGFLSNAEEEQLLQTDAYQQKVAWGIYMGILKFFSAG